MEVPHAHQFDLCHDLVERRQHCFKSQQEKCYGEGGASCAKHQAQAAGFQCIALQSFLAHKAIKSPSRFLYRHLVNEVTAAVCIQHTVFSQRMQLFRLDLPNGAKYLTACIVEQQQAATFPQVDLAADALYSRKVRIDFDKSQDCLRIFQTADHIDHRNDDRIFILQEWVQVRPDIDRATSVLLRLLVPVERFRVGRRADRKPGTAAIKHLMPHDQRGMQDILARVDHHLVQKFFDRTAGLQLLMCLLKPRTDLFQLFDQRRVIGRCIGQAHQIIKIGIQIIRHLFQKLTVRAGHLLAQIFFIAEKRKQRCSCRRNDDGRCHQYIDPRFHI